MVIHPISWNTLRYWRFHHAAHQVTPPTTTGWWFQTLWKIWKSVGIIIPNIWKNEIHVPNHQPDINIYIYTYIYGISTYPLSLWYMHGLNKSYKPYPHHADPRMGQCHEWVLYKKDHEGVFFFDGTLIGLRANWRLIWTNTKYSPWVGPNI